MKITTGIDIIEVNRIEEMIREHGDVFLKKIFTQNEINYCNKSNMHKYEKYAVRFAAKEAVFKALDIEDVTNISWRDIETLNKQNKRPIIRLDGQLAKYLEKIENIDISLSHIKETAIASVVVNWKEN
ncbi:MAG: holo-[acyl-carrier-protein] synthase [Clostridiales bacterium]|nr:holo-[acyl-carrier-protein] synthase [Clostridiales bacterium]